MVVRCVYVFAGVGTTVVRAIPVNMITFLGFEIVLKVGSI